ncbi:hypothetical protein [Methylobacterium sp. E-045]|uniref:hypothetical protein n=1 Tax=Methylobacterium sp. E-045 TaxID=2836575 RepID=UPI001FBA9500|nr:hypothetical protein [Methylobacterium sp. E-045]MCJ2129158.1 hypothetical protein [Methylobacterium sp. E-045]
MTTKARLSRSLVYVALTLGAMPAEAEDGARRLCPDDAPEGVRLPPRASCPDRGAQQAGWPSGSHRIGDVQIRIDGRVSLDHDIRR